VDIVDILETISIAVGIVAVAIILWGAIFSLFEIVKNELSRVSAAIKRTASLHQIRHVLGSYLLLGLEFLIAADIIRTIVRPTLEELAILGGIVVIRTVISYFLGREIDESEKGRRRYTMDKRVR